MTEITCNHCEASLEGLRQGLTYCSSKCREAAKYKRMREDPEAWAKYLERLRSKYVPRPAKTKTHPEVCAQSECQRESYATGLCRMHYRRLRPRTPDKPVLRECVVCGTKVLRSPRISYKIGATCSNECKRILTFGDRCELPDDHMARWYGATCEWKPAKEPAARFISGRCADCNAAFTYTPNGDPGMYCSDACQARAARRRRRAREYDAPGNFTYSEIMRQYAKQGYACAYCKQPCQALPDPEHVLALSRGGRNDMSNLVAACRPCNTDKNDLTLEEWAIDRDRRGLPKLDVTLSGQAYTHLALGKPTRPAWRHSLAA